MARAACLHRPDSAGRRTPISEQQPNGAGRVERLLDRFHDSSPGLAVLAVVIGAGGGLGAILFR